MDHRLRRLAPAAYSAYAWVFVASGMAGVLLAHLEPPLLHDLTVLPEQRDAMRGLLHQQRFLRAIEIGFGAVMLAARDAFFARSVPPDPLRRAVLVGLFAAPAARTVSLLLDGPAAPLWTALLVVEWALFLGLRRASEPPSKAPPPGREGPGHAEAPPPRD